MVRLFKRLAALVPFGEGPVWRDPVARRWVLGLLLLAGLPLAGLMGPASGRFSLAAFDRWIALPAALAVFGLAVAARRRQPGVYRRLVVGLWAGLLGVFSYDVLYWLSGASLALATPWPQWPGVGGGAWGNLLRHWVALGAFWGLGYTLLLGRARWGCGLLYAAALAGLLALMAAVSPHPVYWPAGGPVASTVAAVGLAVFGLVLGVVTERLLPPERSSGKIIFLRDYQARAERR